MTRVNLVLVAVVITAVPASYVLGQALVEDYTVKNPLAAQVITNTERLRELERRVSLLENQSITEGSDVRIKLLETKVELFQVKTNEILDWLRVVSIGFGSVLLGLLGYVGSSVIKNWKAKFHVRS